MKKITTLLFASLFLLTIVSAQEKLITISLGACTGIPLYGSEEIKENIDSFENRNNRVIIGAIGNFNLNVDPTITFFTGVDFISDFNWREQKQCNILTFDINTGIKIYPNLKGFNLGVAYSLGNRTCFFGETGNLSKNSSAWGNGFKFSMEYNFAHEMEGRKPAIGLYWKRMPRGNKEFDNNITVYATINL